jgi:HK97 family phage major capsid protein
MNKEEMTVDEVKSLISETIAESDMAKTLENVQSQVNTLSNKGEDNSEEEKSAECALFVKDLCHGKIQAEKKTIGVGDASFGYTVPTTLAKNVSEKKDKIAKIRKNAFVFQLDGKFQLPTELVGATAYWIDTEADADITESNATTSKKDLDDNYLAVRVRVPFKLLATSNVNITDYISRLSARAIVRAEETAFVAGDGTGEPTGIRTASITSMDCSTAFEYDNLVDLFYLLPEQYRANAKWLMSSKAVKLARKLKDLNGLPIFDVRDNTIFNKEVLECVDIPENLGTGTNETEIYFGDLSEYWIKDGTQMLAETRPVQGRLQVDMFLYESVDGVLVNTDAFRKMVKVK